ncbi:Jag N-terminal domain-containing protein [candidate division WOR-3 bacterium]|nr:Jag N-terminal domain-containing protein [candidate division WOR-3 bacterium]MCK4576628.1 Jag N-terminal domain-containing protein [candidate division WOR-3 bacterium]
MTTNGYCIETGKTVEEAVAKAIKNLECSKDEIKVEILDKGGKKKFLGLVKTPVTVKVSLKDDLSKVKTIIEDILSLMEIEGEIFETKVGSDNIIKIFTAGYDGLLIGKGGRTLNALQYLVSKMAKKSGINLSFYITVGNYKRP